MLQKQQQIVSSERSSLKSHQRKRFLLYNFYGWGLPILFTVITICLTNFDVLSDSLRPNFGQGRCWFQHDLSAAFFLGPIGVLILANLVFFVMTLKYCNKVKREIHRMQSSNEQKKVLRGNFFVDKAQFMMNTKLFVVMGITWVLELLSAIFYNRGRIFFWIVSDSFNVLLGVLVFLIFVFKKRVWQEVLQKLGEYFKENLLAEDMLEISSEEEEGHRKKEAYTEELDI
uniref:G-protein coupled receptors family 2 profile 2 domain-containing protein n=1 Tax=Megaselia scalaris TaxID=36166 RepID=T1GNC3_MEGSC